MLVFFLNKSIRKYSTVLLHRTKTQNVSSYSKAIQTNSFYTFLHRLSAFVIIRYNGQRVTRCRLYVELNEKIVM